MTGLPMRGMVDGHEGIRAAESRELRRGRRDVEREGRGRDLHAAGGALDRSLRSDHRTRPAPPTHQAEATHDFRAPRSEHVRQVPDAALTIDDRRVMTVEAFDAGSSCLSYRPHDLRHRNG